LSAETAAPYAQRSDTTGFRDRKRYRNGREYRVARGSVFGRKLVEELQTGRHWNDSDLERLPYGRSSPAVSRDLIVIVPDQSAVEVLVEVLDRRPFESGIGSRGLL
jgi:hypothetical protein